MKLTDWSVGGDIVKQDERYVVRDNRTLKNLILSSTNLNPNMSTTGHRHAGQEEVYFFVRGSGVMELDGEKTEVHPGDTVLIEDGVFHRVHAGEQGVYFVCVFDGKRYDS